MLRLSAALLATAAALAAAPPAGAQVLKPRVSTGRLPAPGKVSAAQQADGSIRVSWNPVEGATSYTLARSVPPSPVGPVSLPSPSDTQYVDRDVRPGSTYYYVATAVNEDGVPGLKAAAPPVTAREVVRVQAPAAPVEVRAELVGARTTISWQSTQSAVRYRVDRGQLRDGTPTWLPLVSPIPCCRADDNLESYPAGTRMVYRVVAEDSLGNLSPPGLSNEITTTATAGTTKVVPAVVAPGSKLRVGDQLLKLVSSSSFTDLHLTQPHWISLDEAIATVDARGLVRARSPGFTYIVVTGLTPDGAVASVVARVDVTR